MSAFELTLFFVAAPLITMLTFAALRLATDDQSARLVKARVRPAPARPRRR